MPGNRCAITRATLDSEDTGISTPEYSTAGTTVRMVVPIIAATWVLTATETSKPMPVVQVTYNTALSRKNSGSPLNGVPNMKIASTHSTRMFSVEIATYGSNLPARNSPRLAVDE
jgi:hypothetical protein